MNILITGNTIRFEDEAGSHAWPLYMDAPVDHPIITALNIQRSPIPVRFDDSTCTITAGNDKITPETILTDYPEEVRVFAETIYSYDNGRYAEMWRLSRPDEPDTPVTETVDVYDAEGVNVIGRKEVPVMETVIEPVEMKIGDKWRRLNRPVERQQVIPGRKVSDTDKARLEVLRTRNSITEVRQR